MLKQQLFLAKRNKKKRGCLKRLTVRHCEGGTTEATGAKRSSTKLIYSFAIDCFTSFAMTFLPQQPFKTASSKVPTGLIFHLVNNPLREGDFNTFTVKCNFQPLTQFACNLPVFKGLGISQNFYDNC